MMLPSAAAQPRIARGACLLRQPLETLALRASWQSGEGVKADVRAREALLPLPPLPPLPPQPPRTPGALPPLTPLTPKTWLRDGWGRGRRAATLSPRRELIPPAIPARPLRSLRRRRAGWKARRRPVSA